VRRVFLRQYPPPTLALVEGEEMISQDDKLMKNPAECLNIWTGLGWDVHPEAGSSMGSPVF
jgi:hypothetical protein